MKKLILIPLSALMLCAWGPCATIAPVTSGNDPVVVHAEQVYQESFDSINLVYNLDAFNKNVEPVSLHDSIQNSKPLAKLALKNLHDAIEAYKSNRTADNKANITTYLAVVTAEAKLVQSYQPTK